MYLPVESALDLPVLLSALDLPVEAPLRGRLGTAYHNARRFEVHPHGPGGLQINTLNVVGRVCAADAMARYRLDAA